MGLQIVESAKNHKSIGYVLIIISAALAALLQVLGKPLLDASTVSSMELNPIILAGVVFLINGVFFTPLSRKSTPIKNVGFRNLLLMSIIGITEVVAMILFFFGLKDSTAINASIFSNGEILFSLIIAMVVFKEKLHRKEITPFFMIIFGMIVLPLLYDFSTHGFALSQLVFGDILIILAGLFYAVDINICKYVSDRFDSTRITQITSFASGLFAFGLVFAWQLPFDLNFSQLPTIGVVAIFGTGFSTLFFFIALRLIGAVRSVLIYSTTAIFGIMFSTIFLGEQITLIDIFSIVLVMGGIYFLRNRFNEESESPTDIINLNQTKQQTSHTVYSFSVRIYRNSIYHKICQIVANRVLLYDGG